MRKNLELSFFYCIFVVENLNTNIMNPKFKFGQFIVKKSWECDNNQTSYGVFKVTPYVNRSMKFDITYKVILVPVGENKEKFNKYDYYTSDLWDIPEECIFDSLSQAETYMKENFKD